MSVDPEEAAREEMILEIEGKLLRAVIRKQAKVLVEFAEDVGDRALVDCLDDLISVCDEKNEGGR